MGRHTGTAFVRFRSRAAASRVVKMGQTNLLILGGSVLPPRISIADGAADDEYREGDEATVSPAEDVSTGLSRDLLRGESVFVCLLVISNRDFEYINSNNTEIKHCPY